MIVGPQTEVDESDAGWRSIAMTSSRRRGRRVMRQRAVPEVWAPLQQLDRQVSRRFCSAAILSLAQFPGFHLGAQAQSEALDVLDEYFGGVTQHEVEGGTMLSFPGVVGSSIPGDGMDVGVRTALERVENYRRFGAAAAASVLGSDEAWPEPFSRDLPEGSRSAELWMSLEHLAVIALATQDDRMIRVDIDPLETISDVRRPSCLDTGMFLPRADLATLDASIPGVHDVPSWKITHATQRSVYEKLLETLRDESVSAPVSRVVAAVGPRCPWGNKRGYDMRMVDAWYEVRRLERIAGDALEGEDP